MPIPDFDHNLVLPPHLGDPTEPSELSPYPATPLEVCQRFGSSLERIAILEGWLALRRDLVDHAVMTGFQWLDGSFIEDIESLELRPPQDIDVVTFFDADLKPLVEGTFPLTPREAKAKYLVDHYLIDLNARGENVVEYTRTFCLLFSHNRNNVWKGMVRVELGPSEMDEDALQCLRERKQELEK